MAAEYAHPEVLVKTEWVNNHLEDPNVRIVESVEGALRAEATGFSNGR